MFENFRNLGSLMKNAGQMREKAEELQRELEQKTVTGESGGGAVRVTMNGKGRVLRVEIDPPLMSGLTGEDKEMAEELIAAAVNHAAEKVKQLVTDEVQRMAGGMDLGALQSLLGEQGGPGQGGTDQDGADEPGSDPDRDDRTGPHGGTLT